MASVLRRTSRLPLHCSAEYRFHPRIFLEKVLLHQFIDPKHSRACKRNTKHPAHPIYCSILHGRLLLDRVIGLGTQNLGILCYCDHGAQPVAECMFSPPRQLCPLLTVLKILGQHISIVTLLETHASLLLDSMSQSFADENSTRQLLQTRLGKTEDLISFFKESAAELVGHLPSNGV